MRNVLLSICLFSSLSVLQAQDKAFISEVLEAHNSWREEVGVNPLIWSVALADSAKSWATHLANSGCYLENSAMPYGENSLRATKSSYDPATVIDAWGFESDYYDAESNECSPGSYCGHYKQIVWSRSTELGCATVDCDDYVIFVCLYNPPGNYEGVSPY